MKDITILIPVHEYNDGVNEYFNKALDSVRRNQENTDVNLIVSVVGPKDVLDKLNGDFNRIINDGETDFCSQINYASSQINTEFFSILEFDDEYTDKWFKMATTYYYGKEDVSLFLPINVQNNLIDGTFKFENEIAWASAFSNEIGYIDNDCLQHYYAFNITGGIFNRNDFINVGGFKPSIKVSFVYEFLLRLTSKKLKVFVVPKEGYKHTVLRDGCLLSENLKIKDIEIDKWFKLAKRESKYTEDRNLSIDTLVEEKVK